MRAHVVALRACAQTAGQSGREQAHRMEDLCPRGALVGRLPEAVAGRDVAARVTAGRAERSVRIRLMWLQNIDGPGTQVTHQGTLQRCPGAATVAGSLDG